MTAFWVLGPWENATPICVYQQTKIDVVTLGDYITREIVRVREKCLPCGKAIPAYRVELNRLLQKRHFVG